MGENGSVSGLLEVEVMHQARSVDKVMHCVNMELEQEFKTYLQIVTKIFYYTGKRSWIQSWRMMY